MIKIHYFSGQVVNRGRKVCQVLVAFCGQQLHLGVWLQFSGGWKELVKNLSSRASYQSQSQLYIFIV